MGLAGDVLAGVAAAGCDDADASTRTHSDGELVGCAVDGGVEEFEDICLEAEENGFCFRIAEAGVELEDHWAARGHHDAAEEDPLEWLAFGAHAIDYLLRDVMEEPASHGWGSDAIRGVRPHTARVRSGVAFSNALVVLCGRDLDGVRSIAECKEGELFTGEKLFQDDLLLCRSEEGTAEHLGSSFFSLQVGLADNHAFTSGEAGGFDDYRDREAGQLLANLFECGTDAVGCCGNDMALHELFGEGFARL